MEYFNWIEQEAEEQRREERRERAKRFLPELTDDEKAALNSMPDDAVSHWSNGEKWDFERQVWV